MSQDSHGIHNVCEWQARKTTLRVFYVQMKLDFSFIYFQVGLTSVFDNLCQNRLLERIQMISIIRIKQLL